MLRQVLNCLLEKRVLVGNERVTADKVISIVEILQLSGPIGKLSFLNTDLFGPDLVSIVLLKIHKKKLCFL